MDEKTLWLASFKVRVLEGCPVDFDGSEFMYGEAARFVDSENQFNAQLESKMFDNGFELLEVYHLSQVDQAKWVSEIKKIFWSYLKRCNTPANFHLAFSGHQDLLS